MGVGGLSRPYLWPPVSFIYRRLFYPCNRLQVRMFLWEFFENTFVWQKISQKFTLSFNWWCTVIYVSIWTLLGTHHWVLLRLRPNSIGWRWSLWFWTRWIMDSIVDLQFSVPASVSRFERTLMFTLVRKFYFDSKSKVMRFTVSFLSK